MNVRIVRAASDELVEAVTYYNQQVDGLGYEFAAAFRHGVALIGEYPEAWPIFTEDVRRFRLARFPYGILYTHHEQIVLVLGLMHLAMEPTQWAQRIRDERR